MGRICECHETNWVFASLSFQTVYNFTPWEKGMESRQLSVECVRSHLIFYLTFVLSCVNHSKKLWRGGKNLWKNKYERKKDVCVLIKTCSCHFRETSLMTWGWILRQCLMKYELFWLLMKFWDQKVRKLLFFGLIWNSVLRSFQKDNLKYVLFLK